VAAALGCHPRARTDAPLPSADARAVGQHN
jgi:hypothetical protein